jgi:hypothetical protein
MPYSSGGRLPAEAASKLGHLSVIKSDWVNALVADFEDAVLRTEDESNTVWQRASSESLPLRGIWAVDGSYVSVTSSQKPSKEVSFIKTALLAIDRSKLDAIDKENPHPLLLQEILRDSAVFHSTVLPLKNVRTKLGTNYDAVRYIVRDSLKVDQDGAFYETLKWLAYRKWHTTGKASSPGFQCPHCNEKIVRGLDYDVNESDCPFCVGKIFLSDIWGFHLEMDEDSAPEAVASSYMLVMEHLMIFTAIRMMWHHSDKSLVSDVLFLKDGPLTLRGQYSKLVPNIRAFFEYAKTVGRAVHVIGQEKTGAFVDHLASIVRFPAPHNRGEVPAFAVLSHEYVRRQVYRSPDLANPYGMRTNWGEKVYVKLDPGSYMVVSVPTGNYIDAAAQPIDSDLIGLPRILATLPSISSHKFEGALYPIELANGIASMSSYPSAAILRRFIEGST